MGVVEVVVAEEGEDLVEAGSVVDLEVVVLLFLLPRC
jgi:hypothetical protein